MKNMISLLLLSNLGRVLVVKSKVWSGVALTLIVVAMGCKGDESPGVSSSISSFYPDGHHEVSAARLEISATFTVAMNPATINTSTFIVMHGANPVLGIVTYAGMKATFTPLGNLEHHSTYTATINKGAKNIHGRSLENDCSWDFETCHPPAVTSVGPADDAECVALNQPITAGFGDGETDPLTINESTFTLAAGATSVAGAVTYSGTTATFTPNSSLLPSTVYTATITTGVLNYLGDPLESAYVWSFTTTGPACDQTSECIPQNVDLKTAVHFGILAGSAITNVGLSVINDLAVGISPGFRSSITGFPPGLVLNASIYASDDILPPGSLATQAQQDLTDAYLYAQNLTSPAPVTITGDLGGRTLVPGVYNSASSMHLQSGDLILDGGQSPCDSTAIWVFQVGSAFTSVGGTGGNVILIGGAKASQVFWQVGSSATIGDGTSFKGTVMALTSITAGVGSTVDGRLLARNGAVTLSGANTINEP